MSAECFSSLFNQSLRNVSVCGFKSTIWSWTNFPSFVERMQRCGTLQIEALFFYTYLCHFMVVSSRALHPSVGRSFFHILSKRFHAAGLLVQFGFFVQRRPGHWMGRSVTGLFHGFWLVNGPLCGRLFHGFWLDWLLREPPLMVLSSWRCPLRVACWLFTASLWRTDAIVFPSSTSNPSVAFLTV